MDNEMSDVDLIIHITDKIEEIKLIKIVERTKIHENEDGSTWEYNINILERR